MANTTHVDKTTPVLRKIRCSRWALNHQAFIEKKEDVWGVVRGEVEAAS